MDNMCHKHRVLVTIDNMCHKHNVWKFVGWLAFTFSIVNSIAMGVSLFWWGGWGWWDLLLWPIIAGGFYAWYKLK